MTDKKPGPQEAAAPSDDEIAEAAARLSAKWGHAPAAGKPETADGKGEADGKAHGKVNGTTPPEHRRTESSGPILQTLEKGRTHMVNVEVRRSRRSRGRGPTTDA